ncbi:hypothetical protein GON03_18555 [Nocardioides sp. MAH-18]|uniref:Secreted protein n=1 Tax=Nocardioides agri TaxID=2682843 RepID=A0A6L6XVU6_9ACTN|nr:MULTISPECIES: DUF5719 family protein [unclassified Nocardioides]MBA2956345.1 hypothetical protein [Nocardioides sp. CGMCC 1.13656]MVQ51188.1 hypothetical protein [Nocardioides sp. MAH-18]
MSSAGGGRRSAQRRSGLNLMVALAVVLPLASAAALLLVRPSDPADATHPPASTPLTAATLTCPSALPDAPGVALTTTADGVDGRVEVGLGEDAREVPVSTGRVSSVDDPDATTVTGSGDTAPGLVASRSGGDEAAVAACRPPAAVHWFTGVGAGPSHDSVLELTNPDAGTAVADVTFYGRAGVVDAPRLRGVSVSGGRSVRLDLGSIVPRPEELALQVVTARGRLGASVLDRVDRVGSAPLTQDWLSPQQEPTLQTMLLGLAPGSGRRTLTVANPGSDEVRVQVRVVDTESVFAPAGLDELRVPPQSVVSVPVTAVVDEAVGDGALGVQVTGTHPVTASLRSVVRGDVSHAVASTAYSTATTVLVPEAPAQGPRKAERRVVLTASGAGTVTVLAADADGKELRTTEVEVERGRGFAVPVPPAAQQVTVTPSRTTVTGAVLTSSSGGAAVLPMTAPVTNGLVPDVRPGLP